MNKIFFSVLAAVILFAPLSGVQARSSNQGKHLKENPEYNCSVTKKPAAPKWVDMRMKKEKAGNMKRLSLSSWKNEPSILFKDSGSTPQ